MKNCSKKRKERNFPIYIIRDVGFQIFLEWERSSMNKKIVEGFVCIKFHWKSILFYMSGKLSGFFFPPLKSNPLISRRKFLGHKIQYIM